LSDDFRILFVADVVGHPGREAVKAILPGLKKELHPNLTIVNGENAAGGFGLTAKIAAELKGSGADVITTGNHVFAQKEFVPELPQLERVLRPANYPPAAPGHGSCVVDAGGRQVLVMNLIGRVFMDSLDDPFRAADAILAANPQIDIVFCDMHAEATSEKTAMGWYLDGRASAVVGTHTHIPTADARVLPKGTAYVTDVGMVGPRDSCIPRLEPADRRPRRRRVRPEPAIGIAPQRSAGG
jgi:metallophosphoesterase (TIGR00282 family)